MSGRPRAKQAGTVRIIAGQWRSRRLPVANAPGLRPSGDRSRETLFNWLTPILPGARCLDLFAGTGVLGFEALSRGAANVMFVDSNSSLLRSIKASLESFSASDRGRCQQADALSWLQNARDSFDLVFLDPPFAKGFAEPALAILASSDLLADNARVYLETPVDEQLDLSAWEVLREKKMGDVCLRLLARLPV